MRSSKESVSLAFNWAEEGVLEKILGRTHNVLVTFTITTPTQREDPRISSESFKKSSVSILGEDIAHYKEVV